MNIVKGTFPRITRLCYFYICLILLLSFSIAIPGQVRAQSPYNEIIVQIQTVRQQLGELMATYQSSSPEVRASVDAAMGVAIQKSLQQTYYSLSTTDRGTLDNEIRQRTGYTCLQLMQSATTIPGLVNAVDILMVSLEKMAGVTTSHVATTTRPPSTTSTTRTVSGNAKQTYTVSDGAVDIGSGQLKLGWVLYGRTDLSDEDAQAIYDGKTAERKAALKKSIAAATEKLNKDKNKLEMYDQALKDKNPNGLTSALESDLAEARKERNQAASDLGSFFLKEFASKANTSLSDAFSLNDIATGSYDMQTLAMKNERTQADWEKAGKGLAGILTAVAAQAGYKSVGLYASSAELLADCIYLHLADSWAGGLEQSIAQANTTVNTYRDNLLDQIKKDNDKLNAFQDELAALNDNRYIDLKKY